MRAEGLKLGDKGLVWGSHFRQDRKLARIFGGFINYHKTIFEKRSVLHDEHIFQFHNKHFWYKFSFLEVIFVLKLL